MEPASFNFVSIRSSDGDSQDFLDQSTEGDIQAFTSFICAVVIEADLGEDYHRISLAIKRELDADMKTIRSPAPLSYLLLQRLEISKGSLIVIIGGVIGTVYGVVATYPSFCEGVKLIASQLSATVGKAYKLAIGDQSKALGKRAVRIGAPASKAHAPTTATETRVKNRQKKFLTSRTTKP